MKLFIARTGDGSIGLVISAVKLRFAIRIANKWLKDEGDDGSGFRFSEESVEELLPAESEGIIEVFQESY